MIILIRHADDDTDSPSYIHDPSLTSKGKERAPKTAARLIDRYGHPDGIWCSPMYRVRDTARRMKKKCSDDVKITVENDLGRFFTNEERSKPDIRSDTKRYNPHMTEDGSSFKKRIERLSRRLRRYNQRYSKSKIIWVITHALVIKKVMKKLHKKCNDHIKFLESYRI